MVRIYDNDDLPEFIEYQGKRVHLNDETGLPKIPLSGIELEELISMCELDKAEIIRLLDIQYSKADGFVFDTNEGTQVTLRLGSQNHAQVTLRNIRNLLQEFRVEKDEQLVGKEVTCYRFPYKFGPRYLGISTNIDNDS